MEIATYIEDYDQFEVEILADNSEGNHYAFDLKEIKTGKTFSVSWTKGTYCFGMWKLILQDGTSIPAEIYDNCLPPF